MGGRHSQTFFARAAALAALFVGCSDGGPGGLDDATIAPGTVRCDGKLDERVCRIIGGVTPFVLRELSKGDVLERVTLEVSPAELRRLAALGPKARALRIAVKKDQALDLEGLAAFTQLKALHIYIASGSFPDMQVLAKLPDLESLSLRGGTLRGIGSVVGLRNLRKLSLGSLDDAAASELPQLGRLVRLEEVSIRTDGLACESAWLGELSELRSFSISSFRCKDDFDLGALARLPKLQTLFLQGVNLETLKPLASSPSLADLHIESTSSTRDLESLASVRSLERLSLSRRGVDLAPLASFTQLKQLKIYEQGAIGDLGTISSLENLEQLELGGRQEKPVTDLPFMSKLTKLKQVKVGSGFLDHASFDRLKAAYPGVITSD